MPGLKARRILITGGAGFIGYHLACELSENPDQQVVLADNFSRGRNDAEMEALLARPNVELVEGDLTNPRSYDRLTGIFDDVYHLAAVIGVRHVLERPHDVVRVNAMSTLLLLDWFVASGSRKLLFSSTSEAYGWTQKFHTLPIPTPEDVPLALTDMRNPRSSYAGSKIFGELAVTQTCQQLDRLFAIVRYHNVYGPRMGHEHVIPELFARAASGEKPLTVYSTTHRRAFCYVADAVRATEAAMRSDAANGVTLNIGNDNEEITIGDLAARILRLAGSDACIRPAEAANDPIIRRCPDVSRARRVIGYDARVTLDEGLARTVAWYREHGA